MAQESKEQLAELVGQELDRRLNDPETGLYESLIRASANGAAAAIDEWTRKNAACGQTCAFAQTDEQMAQMRAFAPMLSEFTAKEVRENHEFVCGLRKKAEKIGMIVLSVIAVSVTSGIIALIVSAVRGGGK